MTNEDEEENPLSPYSTSYNKETVDYSKVLRDSRLNAFYDKNSAGEGLKKAAHALTHELFEKLIDTETGFDATQMEQQGKRESLDAGVTRIVSQILAGPTQELIDIRREYHIETKKADDVIHDLNPDEVKMSTEALGVMKQFIDASASGIINRTPRKQRARVRSVLQNSEWYGHYVGHLMLGLAGKLQNEFADYADEGEDEEFSYAETGERGEFSSSFQDKNASEDGTFTDWFSVLKRE
jgi:hypothetical protein